VWVLNVTLSMVYITKVFIAIWDFWDGALKEASWQDRPSPVKTSREESGRWQTPFQFGFVNITDSHFGSINDSLLKGVNLRTKLWVQNICFLYSFYDLIVICETLSRCYHWCLLYFLFLVQFCCSILGLAGDVHKLNQEMGAQQVKERERTTATTGSLHSLTLASTTPTGSRPVKSKTSSLRPAREISSTTARSQAFNVFVEHNGELHLWLCVYCFITAGQVELWLHWLKNCLSPIQSTFSVESKAECDPIWFKTFLSFE